MLDIVVENDLYVDILNYDIDTVVFTIRDEHSKIQDLDFEFKFANKY